MGVSKNAVSWTSRFVTKVLQENRRRSDVPFLVRTFWTPPPDPFPLDCGKGRGLPGEGGGGRNERRSRRRRMREGVGREGGRGGGSNMDVSKKSVPGT